MNIKKRVVFFCILVICIGAMQCKKRGAPIEPPITSAPTPPPSEPPAEPAQPPPVPQPPKKVIPPPTPKKRAPSPGDNASLKLVETGLKQLNAGDLEGAEQMFEQALRVSPTNGRPYYYLAVVATKQKDYDRALGFLSQAQNYLHQNAFWMSQVLLQEGIVYKEMNQPAAAKRKFQEAVRKDPNNSWAQKELKAMN